MVRNVLRSRAPVGEGRPRTGLAHVRGHPHVPESTKKGPEKVDVRVGREKDVGGSSDPADVDRCHRTRTVLRTCKDMVRNVLRSRAPGPLGILL